MYLSICHLVFAFLCCSKNCFAYIMSRVVIQFCPFMQMFLSALIDAAGHAEKLDAAFEILQKARVQGIHVGIVSYSSLMGACSNVCLI